MNASLVQKTTARLSRGFVLAFHDIAPERAESFLDSLAPIQPVHLSELLGRARRGQPTSGLCAITVDDGVASTVRGIGALCQRRAWPVTFYLPTGTIDTGNAMPFQWFRAVLPLLPARRHALRHGIVDLSSHSSTAAFSAMLERMWHSMPLETYQALIMDLAELAAATAGVPVRSLLPDRSVTWKEVAEFSKDALIRFESHGISHTAMSALPEEELAREMRESRDAISEHTGRDCRHLAYPFGSERSIGDLAPRVARRYYESAVTMSLGPVDAADPWMLPRIPLYPENSGLAARLKILLKCSRLVPAGGWVGATEEVFTTSAALPVPSKAEPPSKATAHTQAPTTAGWPR